MIYRLCQLKIITSFTIKDKLFAKLPLYLRYLQTKKREEEINNDKKIISNQPIIINQIQPFTLFDIHNLSRSALEKITAAMQRGYVHVSRDRKVASMAQEGECIVGSFKSTN